MKKRKLFFLIAVFVFAIFTPVQAQSLIDIPFGIRPTKAIEGQQETYSYFSYRVSPGSTLNDEALVLNTGDEPVTLHLYAADGVTAQNGGTDFVEFGSFSTGYSHAASTWVTPSVDEVTLAPDEERTIAFQLNIPADAEPGQHVAGLVVEAAPELSTVDTTNETESQMSIETVRRVGVAIVMDVPGERNAILKINDIAMHEQNDAGTVFAVELENQGNVFLKSNGFFVITDRNAERIITTIPVSFDTILPGDVATFYVSRAARFGDGKYLLSVLLDHDGQKAVLEGVGMTIKNGQPAIEGVVNDNVFSPEEVEVFFEKETRSPQSVWIIIAGISFLGALAVGGFVYWLGGRKRAERGAS